MKSKTTQKLIPLVATLVSSATSYAGDLTATIEVPRLDVAEYHRPYIAAWVEAADRSIVADLAVWYDVEMPNKEGETWLKDIRQWWRKSGRNKELPIDGISGPTKPVGEHSLDAQLPKMNTGSYYFVVEASREVGGRELIRIPFDWAENTTIKQSATGERELGKITLNIQSK
ncbi:DUF2271 domain-containing protein [Puniceicoccaceae bacterium K14]|nr:DUF2271 domain-containing protein [Puniceicoccaceae bacterium K14]